MGFVEYTISFIEGFMDMFTKWDRHIKIPVAFIAGFVSVFFITIIPIMYFGLKLLNYIDRRNLIRRNQSDLERVSSVGLTSEDTILERVLPEAESSNNSIVIYSYIPPVTTDNIYEIVPDNGPNYFMTTPSMDSSTSTHCAVFYKKPNDFELKEIKTE